jgi:hypothetical protein
LRKRYDSDIKWDDTCFFKDASKEDIKAIIKNHEYTIKSAESIIKLQNECIEILNGLIESAKSMPPQPDDRVYNHFNINDEVMVFFEDSWHHGFVCNGYRHHDGCVSYILDGRPGTPGCGVSVPVVLLKTEYDFFKENPEDYKTWCSKAYNKSFNGVTLDVAPI